MTLREQIAALQADLDETRASLSACRERVQLYRALARRVVRGQRPDDFYAAVDELRKLTDLTDVFTN